MKKKIYLAVLNQGEIRPEVMHLLYNLTFQNKYELLITYPSDKPISHNRNSIVQDFLQKPEYDYLIMLDCDIVPPLKLLNLVDFQLDIVAPLLFMFQNDLVIPLALERKPDGMYFPPDIDKKDGLIEVDAVGTGCIVLSRKVLESVNAPFMNEYDKDGIKLYGLDIAFCRRAKEKGFKVYCHLDYPCSHWTTMDLKKIYYSMRSLAKQKTAQEIENIQE